jgi:hypothetical protein
MSKKSIAFLALLFLVPIIIYFLWPSDESRIKKLFREGARAVEEKKVSDVMSKISFNYTDEHGLTYLFIKEGCERVFKQMNNIKVEYDIKNIEVKDTNATAELDVRMISSYGQETGYVVGDAAKPAHKKFFLEKERIKWLITKTEGLPLVF